MKILALKLISTIPIVLGKNFVVRNTLKFDFLGDFLPNES